MNKNDVLSLRDYALAHLPKVVARREEAASGGRLQAERAVAWSHCLTSYSPASTAIELQASRLLHVVGTHPETHVECLIPNHAEDDGVLSVTVEQAIEWAEQDRENTEWLLNDLARELCRLSGSPLPAWMAVTQNAGLNSPVSRHSSQDDAIVAEIRKLGHDPAALPKAKKNGAPGVRSQVKAALGNEGMWSGSTVFKKAWERFLEQHPLGSKPTVPP